MGFAVREFYTPFVKDMEQAQSIPGPKDIVEPPTNLPCEKCGRMLEIKWGRNGKFLACPGYKDDPPCKNTQNFEKLPDGTIKIVAKLEDDDRRKMREVFESNGDENRSLRQVLGLFRLS